MEVVCKNCCSVWELVDGAGEVDAELKSCPLCLIDEDES